MKRWKGPDNFRAVLKKHGHDHSGKGLERIISKMKMRKPPTVASIRAICMRKDGRGYRKDSTIKALVEAIGCEETDLYGLGMEEKASEHLSTWDRIKAGCDVEDRSKWPL